MFRQKLAKTAKIHGDHNMDLTNMYDDQILALFGRLFTFGNFLLEVAKSWELFFHRKKLVY
jgi:hypothetical protein